MVKLYVEGGGKGRFLDARFRKAWRDFLRVDRVRIVRGGGREQTYDRFANAVASGAVALLLVDSEGPVAEKHTVWQHLACYGLTRPRDASDDQAFLMVQIMETWFLADREGLRRYFGACFREKAIPKWPDLESVSKDTVLKALKQATAPCGKRYAKGRVSFELLARIDPARVEEACPHAQAFLNRLRAL